MAEQYRKPTSNDPPPNRARGGRQQIRLAPPANDNPTPRAVLIVRAGAAAAALAAAVSAYLYLG